MYVSNMKLFCELSTELTIAEIDLNLPMICSNEFEIKEFVLNYMCKRIIGIRTKFWLVLQKDRNDGCKSLFNNLLVATLGSEVLEKVVR